MANLIEANDIAGLKVYGQQKVDYTIEYADGAKSGCDFGAAVARASMLRSVAVESVLAGLTSAVRLREKKLTDLGQALAAIASAAADLANKKNTDDTKTSAELGTARKFLDLYGVESFITGPKDYSYGTLTKGNVQKAQANTQYAMDKEDNYLQQDMVSVQSYFSKRDQALSMAASLVKKVNRTMTSGIRAMN